jgi:putative membrane protein
MKKLNLIIGAALSFGMLQACHNASKSTATDSVTTVTNTDSSKTETKVVSAVDSSDAKFAMKAAAGGMTEIAASKVAITQATSSKLKDFASMMVTDHTDAGNKLMAIAKAQNIMLPAGPDSAQQKKIDMLSKKMGSDFDKAYVDMMVMDHKKTIKLFESEQSNGTDTTLKAFATSTLPTIHKHLDAITAIKSGM